MTRLATPHPDDRADVAADVLLEVERLRVALGDVRPVDGIDLTLRTGETFALLGESGCGKSMTALALMRLLPDGGRITGGSVRFHGEELLSLSEASMRSVRGGRVGMIFQEPSTSLNPVMTVSAQIGEVLAVHRGLRGAAARGECRRLLEAVGIPDPAERLDAYPFQLSGGMKQRVMIAMALAGEPELLIADEPTTALDVTIQAQILDLLTGLRKETGMGLVLITHDMGVVAETAERVSVQYAGQKIEEQPVADLFATPHHPYTAALLDALPERATEKKLPTIPGVVPGQFDRPAGCLFSPRCKFADALCRATPPKPQGRDLGLARCHYPLNTDERAAS